MTTSKYRDLNATPKQQMADIVSTLSDTARQSATGAFGRKAMGAFGDLTWKRSPDGREISVREVDEALEAAQGRIDQAAQDLIATGERLDAAEQTVEAVRGDLTTLETVTLPDAVANLEAADQAAQAELSELDSRLTDLDAVGTGELASIRDALASAQEAVDNAQQVAAEANTAANAASQAALEAAGIAESKGRVIVSETEPQGEDRKSSNIWIKPVPDDPDTEVEEKAVTYVYLEATDEWQPTTSDELAQAAQNALDAREAAQQAQQRADTAVASAEAAQGAAEAAQRTADQATTDAREAHNEAVAAQETASAIRDDMASGPSLWADSSFERGMGPLPGPYSGRIELSSDWAASGSQSVKYTATGSGGNNYGSYVFGDLTPGHWYAVSATVHAGEHEQKWNTTWDARTAPTQSADNLGYVIAGNDGSITVGPGETISRTWFFQAPEGGVAYRFWAGQASTHNKAEHEGQVVYLDDFRMVDVTESYPQYLAAKQAADAAQDRAEEAYTEAAKKLDESQVDAKITASANGKNSITISTSAPTSSTPGVVNGDTWWRIDGSSNIFGQWVWDGSSWVARQVRSEVIANLDVHKLQVTGSAAMDEAVIDKLFAETFAAHKITGSELSISSVDPDGSLADDSVGTVTIKDGAITTPKLTVTEEMSAAIVNAMSVNTKKLVVTEEAILNHATLIGQTVVDDINVQGKLIGRDGVFTGTVDFENVNVTGTQIVNKLGASSISADKIAGGSFSGQTFEGGMFVGGVFATNMRPSTDGGLSINRPNGLRAWNSSGKQTVSIDPINGDLRMGAGVYLTGSDRNGLVLNPPSAIGTASIYFTKGESMGANDAAIWRIGYSNGREPLMLRGANGEGISVPNEGASNYFGGNLDVGGLANIFGQVSMFDWFRYHNPPGSGVSSSNVYLNPNNGLMARMTSSRRYKRNITDWSADPETVLALQPRTWQAVNPMEGDDPEAWFVGFVAEEVHDLGLTELVQYDDDGEPDALHYATFSVAQQAVLQKHEAEIADLRARIEQLEGARA